MAGFIGGGNSGSGNGGVGQEALDALSTQLTGKLEENSLEMLTVIDETKSQIEIEVDEKDEIVALNANRYAFDNNVSLLATLFNPSTKLFSLTVDKYTVPDVNEPVIMSSKYAFIKDEHNTDAYVAELGKTVKTLDFNEMFETEWHQDLNILADGTLPLNGKKAFFLSIDMIQIAQTNQSLGAVLGDALENSYNDLELQAKLINDMMVSVNLAFSKGNYDVIKVNRNGQMTRQSAYGNISSNLPYQNDAIHYGMIVGFIIIPKENNTTLKQYDVQYITATANLAEKYIIKPKQATANAMIMPSETEEDKRKVTLNLNYMAMEQIVKLEFIIKHDGNGLMNTDTKEVDVNTGTGLSFELPYEMVVGSVLTASVYAVVDNVISNPIVISENIE